ncbi:MAG: hypothetical protein ABSH44_00110 [Bryobacteraceae bacterium]|jgi:hypothetical protein
MKPLDRLSEYLGAIERRLRWLALTRGMAVTAAAALALTVVAVLAANHFAFSKPSVIGARVFLFLGLAFALAAALIVPLIRLNRRRAARAAEHQCPQFEERLLTFSERVEQNAGDPFLELLAADTLSVAAQAEPKTVARAAWIFSFSSAAAVSALVLLWLATSGPGFLGYGAALLWGGLPKGGMKPYYDIQVDPGNRTVRKRSDQVVTARLVGFTAPKVRFFAKYASGSQWEQAEMGTEPGGSAYQFLIAGVPESLEYYVEAGGVRSSSYKLNVVELPSVKNIRVTYHYPPWTGMKDFVENPGGDLRAVEGATAEVAIETDKPLSTGAILLDDGSKLALRQGAAGELVASVPIQKDGLYHVAAVENGEDVRLTEDYFIEAQKVRPPEVRISRPGRDFRATPIEEVTVEVEAKDDFALKDVQLHYSVNGGPERTVSMLPARDAKSSSGTTVIALEDFKVEPGDIVSLYATARDARVTSNTDMFFIETQPFERNYSQSQQDGGDGGGDPADQQNQISQRQKEIITATWNQLKGSGAKGTDAENAAFLSSVQAKLRDQAKSLSERMKARQIQGAGDSFKSFVNDMDKAVESMGPASDKLKGAKWQDALPPEQKALQYLLRAEATFRDIQVAFGGRGQRGGGGGGANGATRDLEGLFDLELDTEKNQYESNRMTQSADQRQRAIDEALQKLEQLARRQQELAQQQRRGQQQTSQQRWQQEMLRREAEQLQRQMEQLTRGDSGQLSRNGQPGQQGQPGQPSGQPSQSGPPGQQSAQQRGQPGQQGQQSSGPRGADPQQLRQTLDRLQQAVDDMRQAASSQQAGTPQGEAQARRAADRLKEAQQMLSGLRTQQAGGQLDDLSRQAEDLARRQQDFEGRMRRAYGPQSQSVTRQQAGQLAGEKEGEIKDLKRLEQDMQNAVRDLMSTERKTSSKLREALGDMQQAELPRDMQRNADWIRRGMGEYAVMSESMITQGLNDLRDRLREVARAMGPGKDAKSAQDDKTMEQALTNVERLRQQLEQLRAQRGGRQGGQRGGQQGGQRGGQQGGQQAGQYNGGNRSNTGPGSSDGPWLGGGYSGNWDPRNFQDTYRHTLQSLRQLDQQSQADPGMLKDIQALMRDLQRLDPYTYANDPLLAERIHAALVSGVEQVEMELRRKVDEVTGDGSVRSPGGEAVPQGYADAVADYFRKLSKSK